MPFCPVPFCPIPFCPYTILSIPFCPYHFVRYHFVRSPANQFAIARTFGFSSNCLINLFLLVKRESSSSTWVLSIRPLLIIQATVLIIQATVLFIQVTCFGAYVGLPIMSCGLCARPSLLLASGDRSRANGNAAVRSFKDRHHRLFRNLLRILFRLHHTPIHPAPLRHVPAFVLERSFNSEEVHCGRRSDYLP